MIMTVIMILIMVVMVIMEGTDDDDDDDDEVHRWVGCLRQRKREESGEGWSVGG